MTGHPLARGAAARPRIPLAVKLLYTAWMAVWVPVYWVSSGWENFFWLCDVANFLVGIALWLESPLLLSAQAVGVLLVQLLWTVDFLAALLTGVHPIGGTEYMFDPAHSLWSRGFSLFHMLMPPLLLWGVKRLGYDRRAWKLQTALTALLLPATLLFTDPQRNLNWVWEPFDVEQRWVPAEHYLVGLMLLYPLLLYLPTHLLLTLWARRGRGGPALLPRAGLD
ncbi:MAG: hypothetical protein ACRD2T_16805, partial [Thermoanaerobaculia bacterium]